MSTYSVEQGLLTRVGRLLSKTYIHFNRYNVSILSTSIVVAMTIAWSLGHVNTVFPQTDRSDRVMLTMPFFYVQETQYIGFHLEIF